MIKHTDAAYAVRSYKGAVTISGEANIQDAVRFDNGNLTITGGYVAAVVDAKGVDNTTTYTGAATITGGTFDEDVSSLLDGSNYVCQLDNETGKYIVIAVSTGGGAPGEPQPAEA